LIVPGNEGAPGVRDVMLLPLNLVVSLPAELQQPSKRVFELMSEYLTVSRKNVGSLRLYHARRLLDASVREVKSAPEVEPEFGSAARVFVRRLGEQSQFDALVMPSLVYRKARIYPGTNAAVWDGVKRPLSISSEHDSSLSMDYTYGIQGEIDGVSLHVLVYDANGSRIFEGYGGIDLVHHFDMEGAYDAKLGRMVMRRDPLSDEAAIRRGIMTAFDPYLSRPSR